MQDPTESPFPRRIFISHMRADEAWAMWVESVLRGSGVETVRAATMPAGTLLAQAVTDAIETADELWVIHSAASSGAMSIAYEAGRAAGSGRPITYILVDDEPVRIDVGSARLIDIHSDALRSVESRLLAAVGRSTTRTTLATGSQGESPASSRGLDELFPPPAAGGPVVARPAQMAALEHALLADGGQGKRVALVGPAGSGKTRLAAMFVAQHRWRFGDIAWVRAAELETALPVVLEEVSKASGARILVVVDDVTRDTPLGVLTGLPAGVDVFLIARSIDLDAIDQQFERVVVDLRLTSSETRELIARSLPTLAPASVDGLVDKAAGNPLLLSAFLQAAASWGGSDALDVLLAFDRIVRDSSGAYFLDTDDPRLITEWERAFARLSDDDSSVDLAEFEQGSWRSSWQRRYTPQRKREIADSAERAAEIAALARPESDANRNNAEAIARLIEASAAIPNLVVMSGSVLLIKVTDGKGARIVSKTLTATQLRAFEENESLLSHPASALEFLAATEEPPSP